MSVGLKYINHKPYILSWQDCSMYVFLFSCDVSIFIEFGFVLKGTKNFA